MGGVWVLRNRNIEQKQSLKNPCHGVPVRLIVLNAADIEDRDREGVWRKRGPGFGLMVGYRVWPSQSRTVRCCLKFPAANPKLAPILTPTKIYGFLGTFPSSSPARPRRKSVKSKASLPHPRFRTSIEARY